MNLYSLINIHLFLEYIADFFLVVKVLHVKEPFQETRKRPNEALRSSFVWWFSHRFVHVEHLGTVCTVKEESFSFHSFKMFIGAGLRVFLLVNMHFKCNTDVGGGNRRP